METMSRNEFAALCGVVGATVTNWMQAGMPHRSGGRSGREVHIDPKLAIPWVVSNREAPEGSQRDRLAKEQADKVALDNAQKRKEMIYAWQVSDGLNSMAAELAASLDALPGRVANELAGISDAGQIRVILLRECRAVRGSVARHLGQLADAGESVADSAGHSEAPAGSDGGPVGGPGANPARRKRGARAVAQ